jgi:hypothetical protein
MTGRGTKGVSKTGLKRKKTDEGNATISQAFIAAKHLHLVE